MRTPPTIALALILALLSLAAAPPARAEGELEARRSPIVKVVERARPAVVSIRTNQLVRRVLFPYFVDLPVGGDVEERDGGLGSGTIFHPDGYVITNAHVIARASKIFVNIPRQGGTPTERQALPLAVDIPNDLAILRILPKSQDIGRPWPYLELADSSDLMLGESVVAMGHPFRLGFTVTQGIISGIDRTLRIRDTEFHDFLQVDAAINPGNSGGPLFDITGRWVGVNTAIYNRMQGAEGIGFAIPTHRVRGLVARAFKRRLVRSDWLGFELDAATDGAPYVKHVYPTGPARRAGVNRGDRLTHVAGVPVHSLYEARIVLLAQPEDAELELGVRGARDAREGRQVRLRLERTPTERLSSERLGFVAVDTDAFDGVRVVSVRTGGPSDSIGLKRGDVIVGLGSGPRMFRIQNTEDLLLFMQFVSKGDVVQVRVHGSSRARDWRRGVVVGDLSGKMLAD